MKLGRTSLHTTALAASAYRNTVRPCCIIYYYTILGVKFVHEVQYSTSEVAIISLSALLVRKVTGGEIIG